MKKVSLIIALSSSLLMSMPAQAGFWGSMAGGAIGSSAGGSCAGSSSRMKKVNTYLWNMYKTGQYEEGYLSYLAYLEQSEDIDHLDTVAKIYKHDGNREKAIEIYETKIMPWVAIEDSRTRAEYLGYYNDIKGAPTPNTGTN